MKNKGYSISSCGTHHIKDGEPAYQRRFFECLSMHEPGIAAVRDETGSFHILSNGEDAYEKRFLRTFGFYEGLAGVMTEEGAHHIDLEGNDVYDDRYAWVGNYQEGLCVVKDKGNNYFHIDKSGRRIYSEDYAYVGDFKDGLGIIYDKEGNGRFIDVNGGFALGNTVFNDSGQFHKGFVCVNDGIGWSHISRDSGHLNEDIYEIAEPFYNGVARVKTLNGVFKTILEDGHDNSILHQSRSRLAEYDVNWTGELHRSSRGALYNVKDKNGEEHLMKSNISLNLFRNELKSLRKLKGSNHFPNIRDGFIHGSFGYILMNKIPGSNLRSIVENAPLSDIQSIRILSKILESLDIIHSKRIAHLDIHPENIMIRDIKSSDLAILDFEHSLPFESLSRYQEINWGKWEYVAPELMMPYGTFDEMADVYSCACLYLNMRSGKRPVFIPRPHAERTHLETREEIIKNKINIVENIPKDCSCIDVLTRMLSFKSQDRPSALQAMKMLSDCMGGR